jgi:hypothetical protein
VAAGNNIYSIEVNAAGTSAVFSINATSVTNTTNIPSTAGREFGYGNFVLRSVGVAAANAGDTDYIDVSREFTTAR